MGHPEAHCLDSAKLGTRGEAWGSNRTSLPHYYIQPWVRVVSTLDSTGNLCPRTVFLRT